MIDIDKIAYSLETAANKADEFVEKAMSERSMVMRDYAISQRIRADILHDLAAAIRAGCEQ